jgi:hypothetical protein
MRVSVQRVSGVTASVTLDMSRCDLRRHRVMLGAQERDT